MACNIVKLHGGKLTCNSEIGKGCTFTVTLPVEMPSNYSLTVKGSDSKDIDAELIRTADHIDENGSKKPLSCLIVDGGYSIFLNSRHYFSPFILPKILQRIGKC